MMTQKVKIDSGWILVDIQVLNITILDLEFDFLPFQAVARKVKLEFTLSKNSYIVQRKYFHEEIASIWDVHNVTEVR